MATNSLESDGMPSAVGPTLGATKDDYSFKRYILNTRTKRSWPIVNEGLSK